MSPSIKLGVYRMVNQGMMVYIIHTYNQQSLLND